MQGARQATDRALALAQRLPEPCTLVCGRSIQWRIRMQEHVLALAVGPELEQARDACMRHACMHLLCISRALPSHT